MFKGTDPDAPITVKTREQLHYLQAVIYEVMRIRPVAAAGVPHVTACDTTLGESAYISNATISQVLNKPSSLLMTTKKSKVM